VGGSGGPEQPGGRAYVITEGGNLEAFQGTNFIPPPGGVRGRASPYLILKLPLPGPLCVRHDAVRDRLYISCIDTKGGVLLAYDHASRLTEGATPDASLQLTSAPDSMAMDSSRDILYLGASEGLIARLEQASRATSTTIVSFGPLGRVSQLAALGLTPDSDRLFAAAASAPGPITSVPSFGPASTSFTLLRTFNPPGLSDTPSSNLEISPSGQLFVVDSTPDDHQRVLRYEPANNYGDPPSAILPGKSFSYVSSLDGYYSTSGFTLQPYPNASLLQGEVTSANASSVHYLGSALMLDFALDPTR